MLQFLLLSQAWGMLPYSEIHVMMLFYHWCELQRPMSGSTWLCSIPATMFGPCCWQPALGPLDDLGDGKVWSQSCFILHHKGLRLAVTALCWVSWLLFKTFLVNLATVLSVSLLFGCHSQKAGAEILACLPRVLRAKSISAWETASDASHINIPVDTTGQHNAFHIPSVS